MKDVEIMSKWVSHNDVHGPAYDKFCFKINDFYR